MMDDRIRLAEAMGWKCPFNDPGNCLKHHYHSEIKVPDPFTDANDDYAVLEWLKTKKNYSQLGELFEHREIARYKIGDYARAALKVLE